MRYVLRWHRDKETMWSSGRRECESWSDLLRAIRILHDSGGISYRRMRVEAA
jgi:hypothetical protein